MTNKPNMKLTDEEIEIVIEALEQHLTMTRDWKIQDEGFGHDTTELSKRITNTESALEKLREEVSRRRI